MSARNEGEMLDESRRLSARLDALRDRLMDAERDDRGEEVWAVASEAETLLATALGWRPIPDADGRVVWHGEWHGTRQLPEGARIWSTDIEHAWDLVQGLVVAHRCEFRAGAAHSYLGPHTIWSATFVDPDTGAECHGQARDGMALAIVFAALRVAARWPDRFASAFRAPRAAENAPVPNPQQT